MGKFRSCSLLALVACLLAWPGCSSNSGLAITLTPDTTQTINQGQTVEITAAVANDATNGGVTWTLSGVGSLSGNTTTSVTYVAPNVLSTSTSATITATSVAKTSVTATVTVDINAVLTITTTSLPFATLGQPYVAVISADGGTAPFNWTLVSGDLPAGLSLSSSTDSSITITGTPTALGKSNFRIQVADSADGSAAQDLSITVNPKPPVTISTTSLKAGTVGSPYNFTLQAVNGVTPYTWQLIAGALPAGLNLAANGVISGTPTNVETASFTVQVTDSSTPNAQTDTAGLSLTINASNADNGRLTGNYAFLVSGFDASGRFIASGSFVADGAGGIASGVMDTNDPGAGVQLNQALNGTYHIDPSGLGTVTFTGAARSFAISLIADNSGGNMIEFNDATGAHASGVLRKQDTTAFSNAKIVNDYVFGFLGADETAGRYGFAGRFHADGAGNFSSGLIDSDDANAGPLSFNNVTGTYSIPLNSTTGRGTATITTTAGSTSYSFYVVGPGELLAMEIDNGGGPRKLVSGRMLQQSGTVLNGSSVFQSSALDISGGPPVPQGQAGIFTTDGANNLTVIGDENLGGAPLASFASLPGGTYTLDALSGRATLSYSVLINGNPTPMSLVGYLAKPNEGFLVGTDTAVAFGFMENQSSPNQFTAASLSGPYAGGSVDPTVAAGNTQVEIATANGVDTIDLITDSSSTGGGGQDQISSGTYVMSASGRAPVTGNANSVIYMVSPNQFVELFGDTNAMVEGFQK